MNSFYCLSDEEKEDKSETRERDRETTKAKKNETEKKNVPFLHSLGAAAIAVPSLFIVQVTHRVKGKGGSTRLGGRGSKVGEAAWKGKRLFFQKKKVVS